jgi:hypothetical protein
MKNPRNVKTRNFKFLSESAIRKDHFDLTNWQSLQLRAKLPRSIYWIQPVERGKVHWNLILLMDYLVSGDRPEHQKLVEEYISTLPTAA